jgi:hypothetical protein
MFPGFRFGLGGRAGGAALESYDWEERTVTAAWDARDGGMVRYFAGKYWLLGGWNPYGTDIAEWEAFPQVTTNEVWSSTDLDTWTEESTYDASPPTSGAGARWKRRHWGGCLVHEHSGTEYLYVLGGDHLSSADGDFSGSPSNGYQCDVWRTTTPDGDWERMCTSGSPGWSGRMLAVFGSSPGALWCFGGQNGLLSELAGACEVHNDLWKSTDGGATWTEILADAAASATRPSGRGIISQMPYWRGRLWLVGGGTYETAAAADREFYREVWSIDPNNTAAGWTQHADPPWLAPTYHSVEVFRGRLWFFGGYSGDGYTTGGDDGTHTRYVWSTRDGERWRRHETPPWVATHAAGTAVNGTELAFVGGNGALTTAPVPPGVSISYALVASAANPADVPAARGIWRAADAVLNGTDIVSIPDSSGNSGPDLVFGNVLGDATYNASDADYTGEPSAESDGGYFLKTDAAINLATFTIFIVGKFARTAGSFYSFYAINAGDYAYEFGALDGVINHRTNRSFEVDRGAVQTTGSAVQIFDNEDFAQFYATTYDGTAAGSHHRIDGAIVIPDDTPNTGDAGTAAWSAVLYIGSDNTGAGSKACTVAEVRVYPALTLAEIRTVEAELRELYF